ncbi:MAG: tetratricopeptide repeat protein [Bacteroidales bacterium]|nr:tetratricopeptide repeat protein [Bacteroidales bacterium]
MNRFSCITVLIFGVFLLAQTGCHTKNAGETVSEALVLNEASVSEFAANIANNLLYDNASALNDAIDKEHIKMLLSENSIVYSGFDVKGGQAYFEHSLQLGDQVEQALNNGGEFNFIHYYLDGSTHHAVFRVYNNYIVDFYDCEVDTVNGKMMIEDCYVYSLGTKLSENVKYNMLYNLLLQTNPDSDARWLKEAEEQTVAGKHQEALKTLEAHREALADYPLFYQLYIVNLYQHNPKTFIAKMETLSDQIDPRYKLFHELHYYYAQGDPEGAEKTVNSLIPYTGDDPIYLFLLGQAFENGKQYDKAVECYQILGQSMPLFWDLWQSEMHCYKMLGDTAALRKCMMRGDEEFGPAE